MITIIKPRREQRGSIRVYDVVQVINGQRKTLTMLAKSTREVSANLLADARAPRQVTA